MEKELRTNLFLLSCQLYNNVAPIIFSFKEFKTTKILVKKLILIKAKRRGEGK